jgi:hypothetical protein
LPSKAVAEHDTQAISFSRRQCNDFTTIALPSPEKYCPCIRSLSVFLSGSSQISEEENAYIFYYVQSFIKETGRFTHVES